MPSTEDLNRELRRINARLRLAIARARRATGGSVMRLRVMVENASGGFDSEDCSLLEFCRVNEDPEIRRAVADLPPGESVDGGGGAAPIWIVTRVD
jgi:hypothetical protein